MSSLLIPFGLDRKTKEIVEPEDAARGRACNCICPGCQAPLLSRHPKLNRTHFAHDSKHPEAKPEEECPFSSAVAVAMMARALVDSLPGKTFEISDYNYRYNFDCCGKAEDFLVTKQQRLTITSTSKKPLCAGQTFDLGLSFGEAKILVDLFYEDKPSKLVEKPEIFTEEKSGVLAINCDTFDLAVLAENKNMRFSDAVLIFLLETGFRHWSFHPRQSSIIAKSVNGHQCDPLVNTWKKENNFKGSFKPYSSNEYFEPTLEANIKILPTFEPKYYRCAICQETWLQKEAGVPTCSKCNTYLFSIGIE